MLAIGFTGTAASRSSLVLAFPGAVDDDGRSVTAGSTTVLRKAAAKPIVPLLRPTGAAFERIFARGFAAPTVVTVIEPFVVEVEADASTQTCVLRHSARLHRAGPDLDPCDAREMPSVPESPRSRGAFMCRNRLVTGVGWLRLIPQRSPVADANVSK